MDDLKKFAFQVGILIIVIFSSLAFFKASNPNGIINVGPLRQEQVIIDGIPVKVEIADTSAARQKGLGGREKLASDSGMLFTYSTEDKYSFWMKNMQFPIDFIWIKDNRVVDLTVNAEPPLPGQKDVDLKIYNPNQPVNKILEVNAGFVEQNNVQIGDNVEIKEQ